MHEDVGNEVAGKGGLLWALGLFLKARKEDKTRKLTFFFPVLIGPRNLQARRDTQRDAWLSLPGERG